MIFFKLDYPTIPSPMKTHTHKIHIHSTKVYPGHLCTWTYNNVRALSYYKLAPLYTLLPTYITLWLLCSIHLGAAKHLKKNKLQVCMKVRLTRIFCFVWSECFPLFIFEIKIPDASLNGCNPRKSYIYIQVYAPFPPISPPSLNGGGGEGSINLFQKHSFLLKSKRILPEHVYIYIYIYKRT